MSTTLTIPFPLSTATSCRNPSQNKPLGPNCWQVEAKKLISLWLVIWKFLCNLSAARNLNITPVCAAKSSSCWRVISILTNSRGGEKGLELYLSAGTQNREHDWAEMVCLHGERTYVRGVLYTRKRVQPLRSRESSMSGPECKHCCEPQHCVLWWWPSQQGDASSDRVILTRYFLFYHTPPTMLKHKITKIPKS